MQTINDRDLVQSLKLSEQGTKYLLAHLHGEISPNYSPSNTHLIVLAVLFASLVSFTLVPSCGTMATVAIITLCASSTLGILIFSLSTSFMRLSELCNRDMVVTVSPLEKTRYETRGTLKLSYLACAIAALCTGHNVAWVTLVLNMIIVIYGLYCVTQNFKDRIEAVAIQTSTKNQT